MSSNEAIEEATDILQQLGLKEYEAKSFVGLSRLSTGTAKQLSEITDVPRTRVYDAVRVLEAQGLVEVQHSSPQRFRAVPLTEAMETLRDQYEDRVDRLANALDGTERVDFDEEEPVQEVWSMTGATAITNRTSELIAAATTEIVMVIGEASVLTADLIEELNGCDDGIDLLIGAVDDELRDLIESNIPDAKTFVSGLEWLHSDEGTDDDLSIGRLLLVDRSNILVSTIIPATDEEHAIFGAGFGNGLIVISRRLMAQGLIPERDPAAE